MVAAAFTGASYDHHMFCRQFVVSVVTGHTSQGGHWRKNAEMPNKVLSTCENEVQPRIQVKCEARLHILDQMGSSYCFELAIGARVVAGIQYYLQVAQ